MALLRTAIGAGEMRRLQGAGGHREPAVASLVRVRVLVGGGKMEVEYWWPGGKMEVLCDSPTDYCELVVFFSFLFFFG